MPAEGPPARSRTDVSVQRRSSWLSSERSLTLAQVAEELNISAPQTDAPVRSGDLQGSQIGRRNQRRVERVKLEEFLLRQEFIAEAYRRTALNVPDLPPDIDDAQS